MEGDMLTFSEPLTEDLPALTTATCPAVPEAFGDDVPLEATFGPDACPKGEAFDALTPDEIPAPSLVRPARDDDDEDAVRPVSEICSTRSAPRGCSIELGCS